MDKFKVVGKRRRKETDLREYDILLRTLQALRGNGVCPKGVYRFKTFEEADQWMIRMIAKALIDS